MTRCVYIAGPIAAPTAYQREQNIRRAEALALEVWKLGAVPICVHAANRFFEGELPVQTWLDGDLELLRRCDAVLVVPGWEHSHGTIGELAEAARVRLPILYSVDELLRRLAGPVACGATACGVDEMTAALESALAGESEALAELARLQEVFDEACDDVRELTAEATIAARRIAAMERVVAAPFQAGIAEERSRWEAKVERVRGLRQWWLYSDGGQTMMASALREALAILSAADKPTGKGIPTGGGTRNCGPVRGEKDDDDEETR